MSTCKCFIRCHKSECFPPRAGQPGNGRWKQMNPSDWKSCDPGCPGWARFNLGTNTEGIQRCDSCARFENDIAASEHVARLWREQFQTQPPKALLEDDRLKDAD